MKLPEDKKEYIDNLSYEQLLYLWRFEPVGSPWFQGEIVDYIIERMETMRAEPGGLERHIDASKSIGWK